MHYFILTALGLLGVVVAYIFIKREVNHITYIDKTSKEIDRIKQAMENGIELPEYEEYKETVNGQSVYYIPIEKLIK